MTCCFLSFQVGHHGGRRGRGGGKEEGGRRGGGGRDVAAAAGGGGKIALSFVATAAAAAAAAATATVGIVAGFAAQDNCRGCSMCLWLSFGQRVHPFTFARIPTHGVSWWLSSGGWYMTTAVRVQPIPLCGVPFKSTSGPSAGWHWIAVGFHLTMSFAFDSTTPVSGRTISMENAERFWGFAHGAKCVVMPVPRSACLITNGGAFET